MFQSGSKTKISQLSSGFKFIIKLNLCNVCRLEENTNSQRVQAWLSAREMQAIVKKESFEADAGAVDCCPSVQEMVEPSGGKNLDGMYVELFRDGKKRQRYLHIHSLSIQVDVPN